VLGFSQTQRVLPGLQATAAGPPAEEGCSVGDVDDIVGAEVMRTVGEGLEKESEDMKIFSLFGLVAVGSGVDIRVLHGTGGLPVSVAIVVT
jgi:hypothetical protein